MLLTIVFFSKVRIFWEGQKIQKNLPLKIWRYSVTSKFKWNIFSNCVAFSEYPNFNGFVTSCWVGLEFNPSINFRMSMPFRDGHRSSIRNSAQIVAEKVANWLFKDGGAKFMLLKGGKISEAFLPHLQKTVILSAVQVILFEIDCAICLHKFTWIVLSVHKMNKLGKFW